MHKHLFLLTLVAAALPTQFAQSQITTFTYQGRLNSAGAAVNGLYDIRFTAYDAPTFGSAVGGPVTNVAVLVTNGLFTASVDLGSAAFPGPGRWLELAVRTNGSGVFSLLSPRQAITAAPYAIRAAGVNDGAITASKLSPAPGANGQVLKMVGGALTWATDLNSPGGGGTVNSVGSGTGLTGGPITTSGTLSIDTTVVPRSSVANTFTTGPQTLQSGAAANRALVVRGASGQSVNLQEWQDGSSAVLASVSAGGLFTGNGANLTGLNAGNLSTGTLGDARLSANVPLLSGNQTFAASNTFNGVANFNNASSRFVGNFIGNGAGLTNLSAAATNVTLAGDVTGSAGANVVTRIRGVNVLALAPTANQVMRYNGSSWAPAVVTLSSDVSGTLSIANGGTGASTAAGARTGLGAAGSGANSDITSLTGLTTPISPAQGGLGLTSYAVGDLLFASGPASFGRLADIAAGNALLSGGVNVPPTWGKIGLTTHVAGTLPVGNGGTGGATAPLARASLGAAASGANTDITSLGGLATPLSPTQGGSGLNAFATGDLLYASAANTLARRAAGAAGQVLSISGGLPVWSSANSHNHFGQNWTASAADGLFVQNTSTVDGSSALTGSASGTIGLTYGVFGQSLSTNGVGVQGKAFAATGICTGVAGESTSRDGIGLYGLASSGTGTPTGVYGEASSIDGIGVYGFGTAATGVPVGVYGECVSATGYGLYTPNRLYVGGVSFFVGHLSVQPSARIFADTGSPAFPSVSFSVSPGAGIFSPGTNIIGFATGGSERMRLAADGKVGIGRVPAANTLEIAGEASKSVAGSWLANSDRRIKTDVTDLTNALEKVRQIRPVSFRYAEKYRESHPEIEDKSYYNVIAQEFATVFPEAVKNSGETLEGQPILQVDTYPASMYAVAAIKELDTLLKARDAELAKLKEQNAALEKRLSALENLADLLKQRTP